MNLLDQRKQEEIEYHNRREEFALTHSQDEYEKVYTSSKFYSIFRSTFTHVDKILMTLPRGAKVLDYCCGKGIYSQQMAEKFDLDVTGIDISDTCIATANEQAKEKGISDHCRFVCGDAEHTPFEDDSFDCIYCSGVLHHLELQDAYKELSRLLKPGGKIIAIEGLAHNPIIQTYRRLTPKLRTSWETDHILTRARILSSRQYFDGLDTRFFHLFTIAAVPFRKSKWLFNPVLTLMEWIDAVVLRIPGIRWWAWICVFVLTKPKKPNELEQNKN